MALLVVATLERLTGLVEDRIVNTFAFVGGTGMSEAELASVGQVVENFYDTDSAPANSAPTAFMGGSVSRAGSAHLIDIYDLDGHLDGSPMGSPIFSTTWTISTAGVGSSWPGEVACKVRWEATGRSEALVETSDGVDAGTALDRPRQRLTGGIYFGPLTDSAGDTVMGIRRPVSGFRTPLLDNGVFLAEQVVASTLGTPAQLGVWSRANAAIVTLEAVAIDNAFDTMRKRGVEPTLTERRAVT